MTLNPPACARNRHRRPAAAPTTGCRHRSPPPPRRVAASSPVAPVAGNIDRWRPGGNLTDWGYARPVVFRNPRQELPCMLRRSLGPRTQATQGSTGRPAPRRSVFAARLFSGDAVGRGRRHSPPKHQQSCNAPPFCHLHSGNLVLCRVPDGEYFEAWAASTMVSVGFARQRFSTHAACQ
jgi:hypothetical protein